MCLCTSVEHKNGQSPPNDCLPDRLMLPWMLSSENPTMTILPSDLLQEPHCSSHNCNAIQQPAFLSEMIASIPSEGLCHVSISCETPFVSENNTSTWNGWVHDKSNEPDSGVEWASAEPVSLGWRIYRTIQYGAQLCSVQKLKICCCFLVCYRRKCVLHTSQIETTSCNFALYKKSM